MSANIPRPASTKTFQLISWMPCRWKISAQGVPAGVERHQAVRDEGALSGQWSASLRTPPHGRRSTAQQPSRPARRARTAASVRRASIGTIHTQWSSQLIGETSTPVTAQVTQPAVGRPERVKPGGGDQARGTRWTAAQGQPQRRDADAAPAGVRVSRASSDWFSRDPRLSVREIAGVQEVSGQPPLHRLIRQRRRTRSPRCRRRPPRRPPPAAASRPGSGTE